MELLRTWEFREIIIFMGEEGLKALNGKTAKTLLFSVIVIRILSLKQWKLQEIII